jgi:hypothetical protein
VADSILQPSVYYPDPTSINKNARTKFYDKFNREVGRYGGEFVKKYEEDLNISLVFVRGKSPFRHHFH